METLGGYCGNKAGLLGQRPVSPRSKFMLLLYGLSDMMVRGSYDDHMMVRGSCDDYMHHVMITLGYMVHVMITVCDGQV